MITRDSADILSSDGSGSWGDEDGGDGGHPAGGVTDGVI